MRGVTTANLAQIRSSFTKPTDRLESSNRFVSDNSVDCSANVAPGRRSAAKLITKDEVRRIAPERATLFVVELCYGSAGPVGGTARPAPLRNADGGSDGVNSISRRPELGIRWPNWR